MKKGILLILCMFLISGCSVDYEIFYKSKNEIIENVSVGVDNSLINVYNSSVDDYFITTFNGWKNSYDLKKYEYKLEESRDVSYINLTKKHADLNELIKNPVFKDFFENVEIYNKGNDIVFVASNFKFYDEPEEVFIETNEEYNASISITIKSNYKVTSNAEVKNDIFGKYTWTFEPDNKNDSIEIVFSDKINLTAWYLNLGTVVHLIILLLFIFVVGYVIFKVYKNKNNKMNQI